jgi:hypothetical protein
MAQFPAPGNSLGPMRLREIRLASGGADRYLASRRGDVAEWLRSGLQIRVRRFDSGRRLQAP